MEDLGSITAIILFCFIIIMGYKLISEHRFEDRIKDSRCQNDQIHLLMEKPNEELSWINTSIECKGE